MWEPLSERRLVVSTDTEIAAGTAAPTIVLQRRAEKRPGRLVLRAGPNRIPTPIPLKHGSEITVRSLSLTCGIRLLASSLVAFTHTKFPRFRFQRSGPSVVWSAKR